MADPAAWTPCGQYFGNEVSCHEGFLVDDDKWAENLHDDVLYPPCPCNPDCCPKCGGNGVLRLMDGDSEECEPCNGTGWRGGLVSHPTDYIDDRPNG